MQFLPTLPSRPTRARSLTISGIYYADTNPTPFYRAVIRPSKGCPPHYDVLKTLAYLPFPEPQIVTTVLRKDETLTAAAECGVPVPATYVIQDIEALQEMRQRLRFPQIAKPCRAGIAGALKIAYFYNLGELKEFLEKPQGGAEYIFQEFFSGDGVGVSTIMAGGKPLALFQHRRLHDIDREAASACFSKLKRSTPNLEPPPPLCSSILGGAGQLWLSSVRISLAAITS